MSTGQFSSQGLDDAIRYQKHMAFSEEGHRIDPVTRKVFPCSDPNCCVEELYGKNMLCLS